MRPERQGRTIAMISILVPNVLIALGLFLCWAAYTSGDPSGLQYMFLLMGGVFGVIGTVLLVVLRTAYAVPWVSFVTALGLFVVAALPQWTGRGYNGSAIDGPGATLALALLVIHAVVAGLSTWRVVRLQA